ncbi:MAG: response regulator transcription factor [Nitrospina sp.]|jgi:two-component system, NarL family, invasion response regulator UvrY|nr:response regulator transcription factor [Nitrospina sp.]MBT3511168.1 response regulator transcription factor [Nitrospina sp.]MBT3876063.1 response regulator transcription factor [Nitrospina sp.]MBT4048371.1 response regulator transcription factor [Nitrospina sp.]MBT4556499.1 response regulator transcription factor [Nitrospina sp.]
MATKKETGKIRIIIADDHPLFRRGLKNAFSETPDIEVVDEAESGEELLEKVQGMDLSLALLDISLPGKGGLEILKQLRDERPKLPVLILTVLPEEHYAVRFFKAGASGFLTKESSTDQIYAAVRKVADGGKYASAEITEKLAFDFNKSDRPAHERLSDREHQVFIMLATGQSPTEIGKELSLSVKTISTHRSRILDKMQMKKNAELIHYAISQHLLQ